MNPIERGLPAAITLIALLGASFCLELASGISTKSAPVRVTRVFPAPVLRAGYAVRRRSAPAVDAFLRFAGEEKRARGKSEILPTC